ncbi:hypothetical protein ACJIZ3_007327 [Penstemon smallii]|uniref:Uncharacterized protein n=1 Tax=Penstemon smallii TaxID=265156 RepID=A0ABD3SAQ2_9LAMI
MIASVVDDIKKVRLNAKKPTWFCIFIPLEFLKVLEKIYFLERRLITFYNIYGEFNHIDMTRHAMARRLKTAEAESRPDVGSSSRITAGSCTNSTPIDTLRFSPPEIPLVDSLPILSLGMCSNPSSFNRFSTLVVYEYMAGREPTGDDHPGEDFEQRGFSGPTWASNCCELSWHGFAIYVVQYTFGGGFVPAKVIKISWFLDR